MLRYSFLFSLLFLCGCIKKPEPESTTQSDQQAQETETSTNGGVDFTSWFPMSRALIASGCFKVTPGKGIQTLDKQGKSVPAKIEKAEYYKLEVKLQGIKGANETQDLKQVDKSENDKLVLDESFWKDARFEFTYWDLNVPEGSSKEVSYVTAAKRPQECASLAACDLEEVVEVVPTQDPSQTSSPTALASETKVFKYDNVMMKMLANDVKYSPTPVRMSLQSFKKHLPSEISPIACEQVPKQEEVEKLAGAVEKMHGKIGNWPGSGSSEPVKGALRRFRTFVQGNGSSCGQSSVAMVLNYLYGFHLSDASVDARYGFQLLTALNGYPSAFDRQRVVTYYDWGDFSRAMVPRIIKALSKGIPIVIALGGSFTSSGYGHIMAIAGADENGVQLADPAYGAIKQYSWDYVFRHKDPPHKQGNFVFGPYGY